MKAQSYNSFSLLEVEYLGPSLEEGPKPAIIYFSLSANESLNLDPYNQPALSISSNECRIFSITLPGHHKGQDKFKAMEYWATHLNELKKFIESAHEFIDHLIEKNIAIQKKIGTMGLSRGGFIALHLATHNEIAASASFAPVTNLKSLIEFQRNLDPHTTESLLLENQFHKLFNKPIRNYIGNRDTRVSTKDAYLFTEKLSEYAYQNRVRSPKVELFIIPSIGQFGHGTLPQTFEEGAKWLKKQIVK